MATQKLESRTPKKGQGVPKETRESTLVPNLARAIRGAFPAVNQKAFIKMVDDAGYYEASMQQQVTILAEQALAAVGGAKHAKKLFNALVESQDEKVHAVAVSVVMVALSGKPDTALPLIKRAAILPGTWPREMANFAVHMLVFEHGFDAVFEKVRDWLQHKEEGVRRVVAEGFRPRGVMIPHINELKSDPDLLLPVLQPLLDDPSLYVRNAVANNLNDVSKDHPDLVVKWTRSWNGRKISPERQYIIKRALRTLVADGHPGALALMGFGTGDDVTAKDASEIPEQVEINALLPFAVDITNKADSDITCVVVMLLDMPGKGTSRRRKKYQIWKGSIAAGQKKTAAKRIHFVHNNSVPKERGTYRYSFTVNGKEVKGGEFGW